MLLSHAVTGERALKTFQRECSHRHEKLFFLSFSSCPLCASLSWEKCLSAPRELLKCKMLMCTLLRWSKRSGKGSRVEAKLVKFCSRGRRIKGFGEGFWSICLARVLWRSLWQQLLSYFLPQSQHNFSLITHLHLNTHFPFRTRTPIQL